MSDTINDRIQRAVDALTLIAASAVTLGHNTSTAGNMKVRGHEYSIEAWEVADGIVTAANAARHELHQIICSDVLKPVLQKPAPIV